MTNFDRLKQQLNNLYALTTAQRALRLGLRALWLGIAGTLFGWGVHAIWGWLPNPITWFLVGLVFACIPIAAILLSLSTPSGWVRGLDQKLGFREEVNTAWEVSRKKQRGLINDLLVQDVLARMPKVRERTLKDGWFHEVDLAATMIIMVLACALLFSLLLPPNPPATSDTPTEEAPLTQPQPTPTPEQAQAPNGQESGQGQASEGQSGQEGQQGQNGQPSGNEAQNGSAQEGQAGQDNPANAPAPDAGAVAKALRELGSQLSQQAGTYDLGQALENMDLGGAADQIEALGKNLDGLSPESRDNLAKALEKAGGALDQAGQPGLAQDLGSAADALSGSESNEQAGQALDRAAGELRNLEDSMQASGAGAGTASQKGDSANTGSPEPLSRLNNEGGELNLPLEPDGAPQSQLLGPASPDAVGEGTASGSLDRTNPSGQDAVQSPLLPNTLMWKWRDVISQYFHR